MTIRHALSLGALIGCTFAFERGGYRIHTNRQSSTRRDLGFEVDTGDLSFDGSLQDVYDLAAEKAKESAPVNSPSSVGSLPPPAPAPSIPRTAAPITAVKVTTLPATALPTTRAPSSAAPTTRAPVSASPVTLTPTFALPKTRAPTTAMPVTSAPTTAMPVTRAPTIALSVTRAPTTALVVTSAPTSLAPTTGNVSKPTSSPKQSTVIDCGTAYDFVDETTYRYAIEYESNYDIEDLLAILEPMMNGRIAINLLPCDAPDSTRRDLQDDSGLVALDSNPIDQVDSTGFCGAILKTNVCRVVEGQMRYFVGSGGDRAAAEYNLLVEVQSYLNSVIVIPGLFATTYLGPNITKPTEVDSGTPADAGRFRAPDANNELSNRSIFLFTFAGVAFVVSIGVAFWFRCNKVRRANRSMINSGESQVTSTKDAATAVLQINTMDSGSFEDNETLSPFSKMLPAAYRLDDCQGDMSVILESVESSSVNERGSSILLSEGYSTEEGESEDVDASHLNFSNYSSAPVLGAKPRGEIQSLVDV